MSKRTTAYRTDGGNGAPLARRCTARYPIASSAADRILAPDKRIRLEDFATLWRRAKADSLPADTPSWRTYELVLDKHVLPFLGHLKLGTIRPKDILDWRDALLQHPTDPRSVNRVRDAEGLLRMLLRDAEAQEYPVNPALLKMRQLAPAKRPERPHLTEAQFLLLLEATEKDRKGAEPWRTMYVVAFFTGARCSEVCGLAWRSVLGTARQIAIVQQLDPRSRTPRDPKARKSGVVDVPAEVIDFLDGWRRAVEAASGRPVQPDDFVFAGAGGKPIAYDAARWALNRHAAAAGLEGIGWHSLRRSFATANVASETPALTLRQLMRHSDLRRTMKYIRPVGKADRRAAERLAEAHAPRRSLGQEWTVNWTVTGASARRTGPDGLHIEFGSAAGDAQKPLDLHELVHPASGWPGALSGR
jgi:integrase